MKLIQRVVSRLSVIGWLIVAIPLTPRVLHP